MAINWGNATFLANTWPLHAALQWASWALYLNMGSTWIAWWRLVVSTDSFDSKKRFGWSHSPLWSIGGTRSAEMMEPNRAQTLCSQSNLLHWEENHDFSTRVTIHCHRKRWVFQSRSAVSYGYVYAMRSAPDQHVTVSCGTRALCRNMFLESVLGGRPTNFQVRVFGSCPRGKFNT